MPDFTAFLVAIGPFAVGITKAVDFVRSFDKNDTIWKGAWIALAFVLGVVLALSTGLNFGSSISGLTWDLSGTAGQIVTGLGIGAFACFWHEPLSGWGIKAGPTGE